jgi:hypothetical protein
VQVSIYLVSLLMVCLKTGLGAARHTHARTRAHTRMQVRTHTHNSKIIGKAKPYTAVISKFIKQAFVLAYYRSRYKLIKHTQIWH